MHAPSPTCTIAVGALRNSGRRLPAVLACAARRLRAHSRPSSRAPRAARGVAAGSRRRRTTTATPPVRARTPAASDRHRVSGVGVADFSCIGPARQ